MERIYVTTVSGAGGGYTEQGGLRRTSAPRGELGQPQVASVLIMSFYTVLCGFDIRGLLIPGTAPPGASQFPERGTDSP